MFFLSFINNPQTLNTAQQQLGKIAEALLIERNEDYEQYQANFKKNNINYRKASGLTWYPVVIANEEIGLGEYLIIDVDRTTDPNSPHQFSGGKNVEIFSNNSSDEKNTLNGTIKMISRNRMRIALTVDDLPDWISDGKLGVNILFDENSYKEMNIALNKVINATGNRLAELRDVMYGLKKAEFDTDIVPNEFTQLNRSQNSAIQKIASAKDVAIIHGPPGTGKTTTLVQAIRETLKTEKQVLVCSPSNTAVDLMTEKLAREGIEVLRLGNPARISEEVMNSTLDVKISQHKSYKDLKSYRKTADEYRNMASKYKRNFGKAEREQRNLLYSEAKKILAEAAMLEDYILAEQFAKAQVIACTPVVSAGRYLRDKFFSTVFIDEAAQALEPMCWIPISRSNRVVFAGDHCQLPPTVKSNDSDAQKLKQTLFEKAIHIPGLAVMLNIQYRMNKDIMGFSNEKFYNNELHADLTVKDNVLSFDADALMLNKPVDFIDTAGCGYNETINPESSSISNPEEAALLIKHLLLVLAEHEQFDKNKHQIKIGIISPYKEQVILLQNLVSENEELQKYQKLCCSVAVKTIDGFQGQEKDMIYISLVRSNETKEIGFLSDTRRMNVALTRAKQKLVVIGDSATLANNIFYKDFLDYSEKIGAYKSAWEFIY